MRQRYAATALPSIFTMVCTNGNYMEQWNDFMNSSGEEQEKLQALLEEEAKRNNCNKLLKDQREGPGKSLPVMST